MLLLGIGFMLGFPTLNIQATTGVADHEQGLASGLVQTSFQIGGAIGLAIVSAVVSARAGGVDRPRRPARRLPDGDRRSRPGSPLLGLMVALGGTVRERRTALAAATES